MASEPLEAEFAFPPVLSQAQEDEYRTLGIEGPLPLSPFSTRHSIIVGHGSLGIADIEKKFEDQGARIVKFDKDTGEDPREWSYGKKWYITGTTSFLCLAVALGSSIVTVEPLLFAPLSEVVGRKPIYCISIFFYFIFTLPSALAKNVATLVVCRQIASIAASTPMCNVGGSVADMWSVEEHGIPMAIFSGTLFLGPCVGPLIGGWIGQRAGWRWIYWVLFILVGLCFVLTLFIPETLAPVILRRKAVKLRKETGDNSYNTLADLEHLPLAQTLKITISRPIIMMFKEPIVLFMSFYLSFVYSLLYLLFFAFPLAFAEIRGFGMGMTGVTFVSIMIGIVVALCIMPYQERLYHKATADGSFPEARLYPMMVGSCLLSVALFIFAFTGAYAHVHWIGPCVAGTLFGFAMIVIYVAANSYIVDSYSNFAASAIAAKTLMRSVVGGMIPLFVTQMFHGMGCQYAGLLLALISCLILPIPFVFYRYGDSIRAKSTRATTAQRGQGVMGEKGDFGH